MKAKIYNQFQGENKVGNIENIEHKIERKLPDLYKKFLLKNNGGRVEPNCFKTMNNEIISQIQFFYGLTNESNYDLLSNYENWKNNQFSKDFLPIAIDVIGNEVVIDLVTNYGFIYLLAHDSPERELFQISTNFDAFLKVFF